MWLLGLISFLLLGGFLLLSAMHFGVPDMVSDIYYLLQDCTGNETIEYKRKRSYGWVFSVVILLSSWLMMFCLLDSERGIQPLAFIGCAGLSFVALAPNYRRKEDAKIHKGGAIVAAMGCIGWCLSVCWWITIIIAFVYLMSFNITRKGGINDDYSTAHFQPMSHPWYWLEISAFADVFLTYWVCV